MVAKLGLEQDEENLSEEAMQRLVEEGEFKEKLRRKVETLEEVEITDNVNGQWEWIIQVINVDKWEDWQLKLLKTFIFDPTKLGIKQSRGEEIMFQDSPLKSEEITVQGGATTENCLSEGRVSPGRKRGCYGGTEWGQCSSMLREDGILREDKRSRSDLDSDDAEESLLVGQLEEMARLHRIEEQRLKEEEERQQMEAERGLQEVVPQQPPEEP